MNHDRILYHSIEKSNPKTPELKRNFDLDATVLSVMNSKNLFSVILKRFEITDKSYECKNVTKPQKYYILIIFWRFDITKYTLNVHKWNKLVRKRSFWTEFFVKFL